MKPILFNTAMVQAILEGRKTTTRRVIKVDNNLEFIGFKNGEALFGKGCCIHETIKPPYMKDILYVRETWKIDFMQDNGYTTFAYRAGGEKSKKLEPKSYMNTRKFYFKEGWQPSLFMPKEAARIFLKVTSVKVEKLQNMKYGDYQNEGAQAIRFSTEEELQKDFIKIWNSTVKKTRLHSEGWDGNPWVWVIEFERCDKPNEG